MTIPSLSALVQPPHRSHWRLRTRRGREHAAVAAGNLSLASAGTGVPLALVEKDPMLLRLAVEDMCWRLAVEDLDRWRPRHGDRTGQEAWHAEKARLESERKQLAERVINSICTL